MIALPVDHNVDEHIVDGLTRRLATLDVVLVRDVGLAAASDSVVLEWAASQGRVLLRSGTHFAMISSNAGVESAVGIIDPMAGLVSCEQGISLEWGPRSLPRSGQPH